MGGKAASFLVACFVVALVAAGSGRAQQADMHAFFEERCLACHGHAGAFARDRLSVDQGQVVGSQGQTLDRFLTRHKGGMSDEQARQLLEMFQKQIDSGAFFQNRCRTCHGSAREFARLKLILRDDVLYGRYSGRKVGPFLIGHSRLTAPQAAEMTRLLAAVRLGTR